MIAKKSSCCIAWFSCGVTSAVATFYALLTRPDLRIVFISTGSEHPDSFRFLEDCQKWYKKPIEILHQKSFIDHFHVIEHFRYLNGIKGARCSLELKKKVRYSFEDSIGSWDFQVFGFDSSEVLRAQRFSEQNPDAKAYFPLIDAGLSKSDCMAILQSVGIDLPMMYKLGFHNNNCVGCVKGGKSYWALIRREFPQSFLRMAEIERKLGRSCINGCFLDEIPLDYSVENPLVASCNLWCDLDFYKNESSK